MIRLYWSGGDRGEINFGDTISPKIVEMMSGQAVKYAGINTCDMAAIGSILTKIVQHKWKRLLTGRFFPIKIWGSGSFFSLDKANKCGLSIAGVRGKLTAQSLMLPGDKAIGDPGLLVDRLGIKPDRDGPRYRWGIIPHVHDRTASVIGEMAKTQKTLFIDLGNPDIADVLKKIQSCDFIISTSLHGVITADAFGIPSVWAEVSGNVYGAQWKFQDYFSMVGRTEKEPMRDNLLDFKLLESLAKAAAPELVNHCRSLLEKSFRV